MAVAAAAVLFSFSACACPTAACRGGEPLQRAGESIVPFEPHRPDRSWHASHDTTRRNFPRFPDTSLVGSAAAFPHYTHRRALCPARCGARGHKADLSPTDAEVIIGFVAVSMLRAATTGSGTVAVTAQPGPLRRRLHGPAGPGSDRSGYEALTGAQEHPSTSCLN